MVNDTKVFKGFNEDQNYNKILFETKNFKVIPSLGSIVKGWLLIIPKNYMLSFGELKKDTLYSELELLLKDLDKIIKKEYGDYLLFEHGANIINTKVGCGVDYAHLHLVPTSIDILNSKVIKNCSYNWKKVFSIKYTHYYSLKSYPYLFYRDQNCQSFIATDDAIPSQLFRKAIASELGMAEKFDWKQNNFIENINETIEKLSKYQVHFQVSLNTNNGY